MTISETTGGSRDTSEHIPLSTNQEFLCLFDQGDDQGPFGPMYHIAGSWRVGGRIDLDALRAALDDVVARHESLRTVVVRDAEARRQEVRPPSPADLRIRDLPAGGAQARATLAEEFVNEVQAEPVSVRELPLLRAVLGRFDEHDGVLVLQAHHTAVDAWSMQLIMRDVAARYARRTGHAVPDLPEVAQYQEYARRRRPDAEDATAAGARAFWRERLSGARICAVTTDWPKSAGLPKASAWNRFSIDAELTSATLELSRNRRSSPFMVLLAAFNVLLSKRTGSTDIVVPTFASGRTNARFQDTVGSFSDFLPLRTDLAGCESFLEAVERTRATCLAAYAREIPFVQILAEAPELMGPLVKDHLAVFAFQVERSIFAKDGERVGDLTFTELRRRLSASVGGDIPDGALWTLDIDPARDIVGSLAFNSNRFAENTINELVSDYRDLLRSAVAGPDTHPARL